MFGYPVILTPDDGAVLVTFPDVPEPITFGAHEDEALRHEVDALETALEALQSVSRCMCRLLQAVQPAVAMYPAPFRITVLNTHK